MNNTITLVEKCIEEEIQKNSKNGIKSLEILNLKTLERIINSKEEYVSSEKENLRRIIEDGLVHSVMM